MTDVEISKTTALDFAPHNLKARKASHNTTTEMNTCFSDTVTGIQEEEQGVDEEQRANHDTTDNVRFVN